MPTHICALTVFVALCLLTSIPATSQDPFKSDNALIAKLAATGSTGFWKVARACDTCERGLFATQAIASGEEVGRIHMENFIDLGTKEDFLTLLLYKVLHDEQVNATYGDYLKSLPPIGHVHCYLTMTDEQVVMLQSPEYERVIKEYNDYVDTVRTKLLEEGPEQGLTWEPTKDTVRYWMAMVTTRAFNFYPDLTNLETTHIYMCPILDLLNNAVPGNVIRFQIADVLIQVKASRDIAEGEELTWSYHDLHIHRPDMQLLTYGFLEEQEVPALSAVDMPDFSHDVALNPSEKGDDMTGYTRVQAAQELERVRGRLESLPTTEEEDWSILESGQYKGDYYSELIVKWRVLRKRALKQRKEALEKMLSEL